MDLNSKGQSRPIDRMQTWHSAGSTGREVSLTGKQHPVELNAASSTQWGAALSGKQHLFPLGHLLPGVE